MMHVRTKFREPPFFCDPEGPPFSRAKTWTIDWLGTEIQFQAPKHYPRFKLTKATYPDKHYREDRPGIIFKDVNFSSENKNKWQNMPLLNHDWSFNGPWFSGSVGSLSMSLHIYKRKEPNPSTSFFHPRVIEQIVADFLTSQFSGSKTDGKYRFQAPVNWQVKGDLNVAAARFVALCDGSVAPYEKYEYVFLPLNDQHMAVFTFKVSRNVSGNAEQKEKHIGYRNFGKLMDDIIGSIKVTLSPEIQAQQEKALAGLDDTSLVKTFPPLKWDSSQDDTHKLGSEHSLR